MKPKNDIPEEVKVKLSICNKCKGIVRACVTHMMGTKQKNEFMKEVMEYNLSVEEVLLKEYKTRNWCKHENQYD